MFSPVFTRFTAHGIHTFFIDYVKLNNKDYKFTKQYRECLPHNDKLVAVRNLGKTKTISKDDIGNPTSIFRQYDRIKRDSEFCPFVTVRIQTDVLSLLHFKREFRKSPNPCTLFN